MLKSCYKSGWIEAGCDEAGRGCLAGPVAAAAVILPEKYRNPLLNDSKLLLKAQRETLRAEIEEVAIDYGVAMIDNEEIDKINILRASFKAMHKAIDKLKTRPKRLLIDGNNFDKYQDLDHICIVAGDGKYMSIAAASILAKTYRDDLMLQYAEEFPVYSWHTNVGYATKEHREAIKKYGICKLHRRSFLRFIDQIDQF